MRRISLTVVLCLLLGGLHAQDAQYLSLVKGETELKGLFARLYNDSVARPEQVLEHILQVMPEILALPGAMDFPWTDLNNIGVKTSEDGMLRVFTWHVQDSPDQFRYFGYMQVAGRKERFEVIPLVDNQLPQKGLYTLDQSPENWYGKLYYQVHSRQVKRKTYYTLMGMDFNNSRSNLKMVEMISIHRGRPIFLKKGFSNGKVRLDRVVLEYSDEVTITVRHDPGLDLIVYDHLVPLHPVYENNYEFYGPDGSFDGLRFEDGTWILQEDIDARMPY